MKFWEKLLVKQSDSIEKTISVLHEGGCRIALVVDEELKLFGTVTDGDIRRAIIKNIPLKSPIHLVMNPNPVTANTKTSKEDIFKIIESRDLLHMPIVDESFKLTDLLTLQQLHKKQSYKNPVLIMAGGFGKRLYPLTKETPKPLLKVGKKPILDIIIEQFVDFGFKNFYISTHYLPNQVKENFHNKNFGDVTINFLYEKEPLGTAGSIGLLPKKDMSDEPLILMNGDLLTKIDFEQLLIFHKENNADATMCVRDYSFQIPYGVIEVEDNIVKNIEEKPISSFFVNAGIYVLNQKIIKEIKGSKFLNITDFLEGKKKTSKVCAFPVHEYWIDIGRIEDFKQANDDVNSIFN